MGWDNLIEHHGQMHRTLNNVQTEGDHVFNKSEPWREKFVHTDLKRWHHVFFASHRADEFGRESDFSKVSVHLMILAFIVAKRRCIVNVFRTTLLFDSVEMSFSRRVEEMSCIYLYLHRIDARQNHLPIDMWQAMIVCHIDIDRRFVKSIIDERSFSEFSPFVELDSNGKHRSLK